MTLEAPQTTEAAAGGESASVERPEAISAQDYIQERQDARRAAQEAQQAQEQETTEEVEITELPEAQEVEGEVTQDVTETEEVETQDKVEAPEVAAIDPPQFYSADQREHFATLDPVSQQHIADLAKAGQSFVSQKVAEAGARANAETLTKLEQFGQAIEIARKQGSQRFATDAELNTLLRSGQVTAEQVFQHKADRDAHDARIKEFEAAQQEEEANWVQNNIQTRQTLLQTSQPEVLRDAGEVTAYLTQHVSQDRIDRADATELTMAWKAMQWDKAQRAKSQVKRKAKAPVKTTKPTVARKTSKQSTDVARAQKRFNQTGSPADYRALRQARRAASQQ